MLKKIGKYFVTLGILLSFFGCFTNDGGKTEEGGNIVNNPNLSKIVLLSDKIGIVANNTDIVNFTVKGYDKNDIEITPIIKIYKDGEEISGTSFKTSTEGRYKFMAKAGDIISNEIIITARQELKEYVVDIKGYTYSYEAMAGMTRTVSATNVKIDGKSVDIGMMKITEGIHLLEFKGYDKQPSKYDSGKIKEHKYTINILANCTLKIYPWTYELELK